MPSESTFLLAGLLFVAAALGYLFARYAEDSEESDPEASGRLNSDYIRGLNFLLNEQPDQALEVFIRMVEVDNETLETHFALGGLFRRRGEVDRAIRVHQNLIARPNLNQEQRDQAYFALAEDYLRSGLYDRAEKIFIEFEDSSTHCDASLNKLLRIYEMTHDWEQAIEVYLKLEQRGAVDGGPDQVVHYYCELAEQAKDAGDLHTAEAMLSKAIKRKPDSVRAQLMEADLLQEAGEHARVVPIYARVIRQDSRLASEVIPRMARSCREVGGASELSSILSELIAEHASARDAIALAAIRDEQIQNPVALDCVQQFAVDHAILGALIDIDHLTHEDPAVRAATMARIRTALGRIAAQSSRYSCTKCGYATMELLWQCPSCREWETVVPNQQLALGAVLS